MLNLYLDIDGVLLTTRHSTKPAGIEPLLDIALNRFTCYWLTTHCRGDAATALRYLAQFYESYWLNRLAAVRPTNWDALKTDGIDFTQPFRWLEDAPFEAEKAVLSSQQCQSSLVLVNLRRPLETDRVRLLLEQLSR
ncbi:hypothetical protein [Hymenobacter rigui]|uniref:HAD family hydrolase n=1 Tax=Hymenobacter rigui TaxID=334424 RepID=A0A428KUV7_9BACT|nr:hypothetical protein [Hymenobacter rigui]RSK50304.1 hypothetical protein EI291_06530 [Hymenobacter rigui]